MLSPSLRLTRTTLVLTDLPQTDVIPGRRIIGEKRKLLDPFVVFTRSYGYFDSLYLRNRLGYERDERRDDFLIRLCLFLEQKFLFFYRRCVKFFCTIFETRFNIKKKNVIYRLDEKSRYEITAISLLAKISFTDCDKIFCRKPEFKAEQFPTTNDFPPWIFKNITIINFSLPLPFARFNLLNVSTALLLCLNMFESNVYINITILDIFLFFFFYSISRSIKLYCFL